MNLVKLDDLEHVINQNFQSSKIKSLSINDISKLNICIENSRKNKTTNKLFLYKNDEIVFGCVEFVPLENEKSAKIIIHVVHDQDYFEIKDYSLSDLLTKKSLRDTKQQLAYLLSELKYIDLIESNPKDCCILNRLLINFFYCVNYNLEC